MGITRPGMVSVTIGTSGVVFAATARVGEYAQGLAVVRREGRVVVTSAVSGTVQSLEAKPGSHVAAGQVEGDVELGQDVVGLPRSLHHAVQRQEGADHELPHVSRWNWSDQSIDGSLPVRSSRRISYALSSSSQAPSGERSTTKARSRLPKSSSSTPIAATSSTAS